MMNPNFCVEANADDYTAMSNHSSSSLAKPADPQCHSKTENTQSFSYLAKQYHSSLLQSLPSGSKLLLSHEQRATKSHQNMPPADIEGELQLTATIESFGLIRHSMIHYSSSTDSSSDEEEEDDPSSDEEDEDDAVEDFLKFYDKLNGNCEQLSELTVKLGLREVEDADADEFTDTEDQTDSEDWTDLEE
ncbi:FK506-binding protein 3-like [Bradysia coprophila]|uniref:FK506-binding protein 3-like n=1 Tax=Bradysia coprophila TaxID=38358 RepID=UPI00187DD3D5|nr:FK506-binding protein 3-like [Bradysia coprophila]